MYESLKEHSSDFHLYIFAFDDLSEKILRDLKLEYTTVISLTEFETDELLEVKKGRSKAEYCWTCTPSVISYVFEKFNTSDCTYIDADLLFYSDPSVLIKEMEENGKNVLITEHRYSFLPRLYEEKRAGRFCVQFMTFINEGNSLFVLDIWRKQCIDWCFARHEDGKFGDQKYLEEWPVKYDNIHILEHQGGGVAPWNQQKYCLYSKNKNIKGRLKLSFQKFDLVFYHFQYVKYLGDRSYDAGWYLLSKNNIKLLYLPYIRQIERIEKEITMINAGYMRFSGQLRDSYSGNYLKKMLKVVLKYNIIKITSDGLSD